MNLKPIGYAIIASVKRMVGRIHFSVQGKFGRWITILFAFIAWLINIFANLFSGVFNTALDGTAKNFIERWML